EKDALELGGAKSLGQAARYSKNPEPAPFTFSPSITFHCLSDQDAAWKLAGSIESSRARRPLTSRICCGGSPSTTKLQKLRCSTVPVPSASRTASTRTAGSSGIG